VTEASRLVVLDRAAFLFYQERYVKCKFDF